MFSGFFGKSNKGAKSPGKEGVKTRGVEVIEDDPDTAWGLWDSALAEQDSRFSPSPSGAAPLAESFDPPPVIDFDVGNAVTQPMQLDEKTLEQRKDDALNVVEMHHQRIANTIRTLWGYKECSVYINKLIMNGGDGMGHARVGFNQSAAEAMLVLADIHDSLYGSDLDPSIDFTDTKRSTGWGKLR
ncbi:MAG: hypothetical protein CFE44_02275 [Burkholderiales bacterium PBB4]|nr:MAG: hypothetical protein CFE44_02275 [Burkholderiales bacterium PBB4]